MCNKKVPQIVLGLVLSVVLAAAVQADITTGLVGYWPLNGDALDESSNDLHGTAGASVKPAPDRLSYPDSAMSFTGAADSAITIKDNPLLQITGEMTLAAWVYLNKANANNARIIAKSGGSGARSWSLNIELTSGGVALPATFQIASSGSTNLSVLDTQPLATDQWVHMTGIYRPGEAMEVYVNGELRATRTTGIPNAQYSNNSLPVMIGSRNACSNCGWNGMIDEARVYARALSPDEVKELFQFHPTPRLKAWSPRPADGAEDVTNPLLEWKAGSTAKLHNVYIGTDPNLTETDLAGPRSPLTMFWYGPGVQPGQKYCWRVDEIEADGTTIHTGDVWSFTGLPLTAYHPDPADGSNAVAPAPTLTWRAGKDAVKHHLYVSDSLDAVAQGAADANEGILTATTFAPTDLQGATLYYWRVDQITSDGQVTVGPVWSFVTFLSVDDFEGYTDDEGGRVYETWIDGWTNNTGSTVGYVQAPFAERSIVHGGKQSMPLEYNNVNTPYYSEAERAWDTQQNWTADELDTLVLYLRGRTANAADKLYVVVEDSSGRQATVTYPDAALFTATSWTEWKIPLSDLSGAGVNLARVKKMYLGVGNRTSPAKGGAGLLYVDDIRLLRPAPAQP